MNEVAQTHVLVPYGRTKPHCITVIYDEDYDTRVLHFLNKIVSTMWSLGAQDSLKHITCVHESEGNVTVTMDSLGTHPWAHARGDGSDVPDITRDGGPSVQERLFYAILDSAEDVIGDVWHATYTNQRLPPRGNKFPKRPPCTGKAF
jgi:hypothetical protein